MYFCSICINAVNILSAVNTSNTNYILIVISQKALAEAISMLVAQEWQRMCSQTILILTC